MNAATRRIVRERAYFRCEYCHLPESAIPLLPFHVEHVIARQHRIDHSLDNLALACDRCNLHKGPNLSGIDPVTGTTVELFHPRKDVWENCFREEDGQIIGLAAAARATVALLSMNATRRVELRRLVAEKPEP